jgi:ABC-type sugar transport system substrate-binding protein
MTQHRSDRRAAPTLGAVLAGEPLDRRTALKWTMRAGAAATLGAGLPAALAGCGTTTPAPIKNEWVMKYLTGSYGSVAGGGVAGSGSPPLGDLARLMRVRARALDVIPALIPWTTDEAGDIRALLAPAKPGADPETGKAYPPAEPLLVLGLADRSIVDPVAAEAIKADVKVVSYLTELTHQTAAISVNPALGGTLLATHAAGWAHQQLAGRGHVLLIRPAPGSATDPRYNLFSATAPQSERALRSTLARAAPALRITAATVPRGDQRALSRLLSSHATAAIVLCWDDAVAVAAARELRARHPTRREQLYVGGLGLPALTSRDAIDELRRNDVLRAVVAARPSDLANALIDVPRALLRNEPPRTTTIAPATLTPGSRALAAHDKDYSRNPARFVTKFGTGDDDRLLLNPTS